MIIHEEKCVGCGRCQTYCSAGAIKFVGLISEVDQDKCYECGTCLRVGICPVDALEESPYVYDYPRAIRKFFSDATATHKATNIEGRGTEESKTNDVTGRCGPDDVGIGIEVGRPILGMELKDIQKITRALAQAGITEIERDNPIQSMISDQATGDLKPELLNERVLSAIIEIQVKWPRLPLVLKTIKKVSREVNSVFSLFVYAKLEPELQMPAYILDTIKTAGFTWRPNAKINMGLGRAMKPGE